MRTEAEREEANRLFSTGLSAWQIAKAMGIPRSTIRDWVEPGRQDRQRYTPVTRLPRKVDFIALPKHDHAYLLGLYLGDGTISGSRRGVYRLRIFMDSRCPKIIGETVRAMQAVMPHNKVNVQKKPYNCVEISCYSKLWPELFPQHGQGPKHTRRIELVPWQERAVARCPWQFVRGLIQSDGCRVINRVNGGEYPRYLFSQVSDDIRKIFCEALDFIGVEWKQNRWNSISVARRQGVELLDSFIGPKA